MAERNGHKNVVRQGDEYVCYACGKRWDDTDERNGEMPACTIVERQYGGRLADMQVQIRNARKPRR